MRRTLDHTTNEMCGGCHIQNMATNCLPCAIHDKVQEEVNWVAIPMKSTLECDLPQFAARAILMLSQNASPHATTTDCTSE